MRTQLLVMQKAPLRAPSTRASLFKFKSMHLKVSLVVVDGLVCGFQACVHIAADFPHQWPQSDHGVRHSSKFSLRVFGPARTVAFVGFEDRALYGGALLHTKYADIYAHVHTHAHTYAVSYIHTHSFFLSLSLSLSLSLTLSLSLSLCISRRILPVLRANCRYEQGTIFCTA